MWATDLPFQTNNRRNSPGSFESKSTQKDRNRKGSGLFLKEATDRALCEPLLFEDGHAQEICFRRYSQPEHADSAYVPVEKLALICARNRSAMGVKV